MAAYGREVEEFWGDPSFRSVMGSVNGICEQLLLASRLDDDPDYAITFYQNAADYLTLDVNQDDYQGTLLLKGAIEKLYSVRQEDRQELETDELDYLSFSIQIIIQCQRLWLSMVPTEEERSN